MKLLVRRQVANLRDDKELQNEGLLNFLDKFGLVLKHPLWDLAK